MYAPEEDCCRRRGKARHLHGAGAAADSAGAVAGGGSGSGSYEWMWERRFIMGINILSTADTAPYRTMYVGLART